MINQPGYRVVNNSGVTLFEAFGDDAEAQCLAFIRNRYGPPGRFGYPNFGFRIESTSRSVTAYSVLMDARLPQESEQHMADDIETDGYRLGASLAKIIAPGGTADSGSLINLGMFFSELRGYRDLRTGNTYVSAFVRGFEDNTPGAAIDSAHRLGDGGKSS